MHWGIPSTLEEKLEELDMIVGNNALGDYIYTRGETGRARHDRRQQCTGGFYALGDSIYTRGETGRVGRDGWQSEAIIFVGKEDSIQVK